MFTIQCTNDDGGRAVTMAMLPPPPTKLYQMALYGAEALDMGSAERRKVNVLEMKCLRSLVGVSRMDRVKNEEVRRRAGIERELASRAKAFDSSRPGCLREWSPEGLYDKTVSWIPNTNEILQLVKKKMN